MPLSVIEAARAGDPLAVERVLRYYEGYIDNEHSEIIKNLIRLKNKLQSEGRYTDAVDDLIIKFSSAKMKSIQIK